MCGEPSDGVDSDCSVSSNSGKQVLVGICAMAKKTQSKPMKEILTRLQEFEYIRMVVFAEDVILKVVVLFYSNHLSYSFMKFSLGSC